MGTVGNKETIETAAQTEVYIFSERKRNSIWYRILSKTCHRSYPEEFACAV